MPPTKFARYPMGSTSLANGICGSVGDSRRDVKYRFVRCIPKCSSHLSMIVHSPNLFSGMCLSNNACTSLSALIPFSKVSVPNPVSVTLCRKNLTLFEFGLENGSVVRQHNMFIIIALTELSP